MKLAEALLPLVGAGAGVIAFVGGGGKTTALFRLAGALEQAGRSVLVTATTHLWDPRLGTGAGPAFRAPHRPALNLLLRPELEGPFEASPLPAAEPGLTVLMSREAEPPGKLKGLHPSWINALRASWDFILVEADGSRGLPLKAPAGHEPVLPPGADLVVGVVGLDCLGRPMDGRTVHRPEHFSAITGCQPGQPVAWEHLAALIAHPQGLFKDTTGPRALLLNKAELVQGALPEAGQLAALPADRVLLGSLEPLDRVMVMERGRLL